MSDFPFVDLYQLIAAQVHFARKRDLRVDYELFINADQYPYYVLCGLDDALDAVARLRFSDKDIEYLRSLALFENEFLEYLKKFAFRGDIWGVEEPEVVFSREPVVRVSGSLIEAELIESILLNTLSTATAVATKSERLVRAAKGRGVYDFSLRKTQGPEAASYAARYSFLGGVSGTSNVRAGRRFGIPVVGTMNRSFVMSFERETLAFFSFAAQYPARSILMVDTYNFTRGIQSAMRVARILKKEGCDLLGLCAENPSDDEIRYLRRSLDQDGFIDTLLFVSGNLDEHRISKMIKKRIPVDAFGVGAHIGSGSHLPYTDMKYVLVNVSGKPKHRWSPVMSLQEGNTTIPGVKQLRRRRGADGKIESDLVGLDGEKKLAGKKIWKRLMRKGERVAVVRTLKEKRKFLQRKSGQLPASALRFEGGRPVPVKLSGELAARAAGTGKLVSARTALKLLFFDIDSQFDFIRKPGSLRVEGCEKIVKNLKALTRTAAAHNIAVVSSRELHRKDSAEFREFSPHCVRGTAGAKKIPETTMSCAKTFPAGKEYSDEEITSLVSRYPQYIIEKNSWNIFSNPNTVKILQAVFPDKIYVYGVAAEYAVKEAVQGLCNAGFEVAVVDDALRGFSAQEKKRVCAQWKKQGVEFVNTAQVVRRVEGR
ncbi:MAG: nicotinate phosphoribosyltransferase [Candidatus Omnitrophica bacterium]|nr:nicotinate phosphoribosyltransferase [Candidatus Omnitrophota bacterium]